jgi:hypothetical protein
MHVIKTDAFSAEDKPKGWRSPRTSSSLCRLLIDPPQTRTARCATSRSSSSKPAAFRPWTRDWRRERQALLPTRRPDISDPRATNQSYRRFSTAQSDALVLRWAGRPLLGRRRGSDAWSA